MTDDVFKALSDPSRRKIVDMLNQEGEMSAGDIAARFSISAPSVSHHLAILRAAGPGGRCTPPPKHCVPFAAGRPARGLPLDGRHYDTTLHLLINAETREEHAGN